MKSVPLPARNFFVPVVSVLLAALLPLPAVPPLDAADDTFTAVNPYTDQTEAVWAGTPLGGSNREIFHSVQTGEAWSSPARITQDDADDRYPHLAFTPEGDRRLAWCHDAAIDTIEFSARTLSGGSWSDPETASDGTENARNPRVAVHEGETFVAWEGVPASGNVKVIVGREAGPDPWSRTLVATTSSASSPAVRITSEEGHLWVAWIDSSSVLGYAEYANGTWGSVQTESYSGGGDVEAARGRIRTLVLG